MIFSRYLATHVHKGAALVILILVSLSLFFTLVQQIDDLGKGQFGVVQLIQYLLYRIPSLLVDYMPLAALLGTILSLGNLASNSELIALQSSGLSVRQFILTVVKASLALALLSLLVAEFIVPQSETRAKEIKSLTEKTQISMHSRRGVWIKDDDNIIFLQQLFPNGNAVNVEIYHLNDKRELLETTFARQAVYKPQGWILKKVSQSKINNQQIIVNKRDQLVYQGKLSESLLEALVIKPRLMSIPDLYTYIHFMQQNQLNFQAESLSFWQKIYAPLSVIVMSLLAIPFVFGSQRQSNTGQRIMIGILFGLVYVVLNRVLIQLGSQLQLLPALNALIPTLIMLLITAFLIRKNLLKT